MLEKPDLQDEKIIACVQDEYGLLVVQLAFLPLGADPNTAVYRAVAADETPYFVKLRRGGFDATAVTLPKFLSDQGIVQIMPRWRAGVRYDRLFADNTIDDPVPGTSLGDLADDGHDPQRWSAMVDFSNSEFSRFRLQVSRDDSRPGTSADDQVFLQYIFSLGSHPAHQF